MTTYYVDASWCPFTFECGIGIKTNRIQYSRRVKASGSLAGELIAIIRALAMAQIGDTIYSDCKTAVDAIMDNRLLVRHESLCMHALCLFHRLYRRVKIKWIKRIHNTQADKLARRARQQP